MTPITLIIDRTFKGVGRIKLRTGTTLPAVRRKLNRMLDVLANEGRVDLLRAVRDRQITLMQLHDAYQRKALDQLPTGATSQPLISAMRTWIESLGVSVKHGISLEMSCRYLERQRANAAIADLPMVLDELRRTLGRSHPRSFNIARSAASAFVRQTFKRSHPLYQHVLAVELVPVKSTQRRHPLTVVEMRTLFPAPAVDPLDAIAWGMATTGMGAGEYWGRWSAHPDRIHIEGTKREGRVRDVPLVLPLAVPRMHRRTFEDKLRERTARAIVPYDLRRTYANWLEAAGITRTRRRLYMGHGVGDVTGLYELHEVASFLEADGATLRAFVGVDPTPSIRLHSTNSG